MAPEAFGEPADDRQEHLARLAAAHLPGHRRRKVSISFRKVKIGSHAQTAITPEQRKKRAKSQRRLKRRRYGNDVVGSSPVSRSAVIRLVRENEARRYAEKQRILGEGYNLGVTSFAQQAGRINASREAHGGEVPPLTQADGFLAGLSVPPQNIPRG